jgi:TonB family protein
MRRILILTIVLLFCSATALADGLRSDKHLVKVDPQPRTGDSRQYSVQIFDAESRTSIASLKVTTKGNAPAEAEATAGSTRYTVRVVPYGDAYLIEFNANEGGEVIDTLRGGFAAATGKPKPAPAPTPAQRGGRDLPEAAVLRRVEPVYTEDAKAAGAAGRVVLEVLIGRSGFVRDVTVLTPMAYGLSESAVDAVKQWQFEPSMQDRGPIEVVQEVTIEFKP